MNLENIVLYLKSIAHFILFVDKSEVSVLDKTSLVSSFHNQSTADEACAPKVRCALYTSITHLDNSGSSKTEIPYLSKSTKKWLNYGLLKCCPLSIKRHSRCNLVSCWHIIFIKRKLSKLITWPLTYHNLTSHWFSNGITNVNSNM